jgi:DNA replication and repair protein RecF
MKIDNIKSWNFRSFTRSDYSFSKGINIICGHNATGKTSLLEQIYVLCLTKSHRSKKDIELISFGQEYLVLKGIFSSDDKNLQLQLSISNKGKIAKIGIKEVKNLSSYIGTINVVLFCPEDLMIVKGAPSDRRKFIDVEMGQISPSYLKDLIEYKDLLKQRNATLKELSQAKEGNKYYTVLSVIDEKIVSVGIKIIQSRKKFIDLIHNIAIDKMNAISSSNETIQIIYNPNTTIEEYKNELKATIELDIVRGSTSIGPHRDDFSIQVNKQDVSVFGSQGQQRSVVLALKLSLLELISKVKKEIPILLLDDVFSELDERRQNEIMKLINMGAQTFITTTSIQEINKDILEKSKVIYLTKENINER